MCGSGEEVGVWFNTELIWILQGKPRNEDEMYHIDDLSGRSDNEALRIINNPKTTLTYLNKTDDDEQTRRTALAVACGGLTRMEDHFVRRPNFKIIRALLNLFCLKYTLGTRRKRKYLIYYGINLLTEPLDNKIKLITNEQTIHSVLSKINVIYKQIKKNEIKPDTDYLFNNSITNTNLEKTIKRLDTMSALTGMIPRNK